MMSNNQDHIKELVNKSATRRKLWVAGFGPFAEDALQCNSDFCTVTADIEDLNYVTSVVSVFNVEDLKGMCTVDLTASEHNEFTTYRTTYLSQLKYIKKVLSHECIKQSHLFDSTYIDLSNRIIIPLLEKAI